MHHQQRLSLADLPGARNLRKIGRLTSTLCEQIPPHIGCRYLGTPGQMRGRWTSARKGAFKGMIQPTAHGFGKRHVPRKKRASITKNHDKIHLIDQGVPGQNI